MIFQEKKNKKGYEYFCKDLFEITIESDRRLTAEELDSITSYALNNGSGESEGIKFIIKKETWIEEKKN